VRFETVYVKFQEKERIQKDLHLAHMQLEVQKLRHEEAQMNEYLSQQIDAATTAQSEISSTEHELQLAKKELSVKQGKLNQLNIKLAKHLEKIEVYKNICKLF
jgi:archaellum component FlaC